MTKQEIKLINSKKNKSDFDLISKNTGLSDPTVRKFIKGDTGVSLKNSYKICKVLGLRIRIVEQDFNDSDYIHKSRVEDMILDLLKNEKGDDSIKSFLSKENIKILNQLLNG